MTHSLPSSVSLEESMSSAALCQGSPCFVWGKTNCSESESATGSWMCSLNDQLSGPDDMHVHPP